MIYEVEISAQAESDLRGIYEYIAYELQSPESAASQLNRLEQGIVGLEKIKFKKNIYSYKK